MRDQISQQTQNNQSQYIYIVPARNKKIGLIWIVAPQAALILTALIYVRLDFIGGLFGELVLDRIKFICEMLALFFLIAFIIGVPIGIYFLFRKKPMPYLEFDERSGKGESSEVPEEIKVWNWGAAGLTWIWGLFHKVWFSLLLLVPIPLISLILMLALGKNGNEWAWRKNQWESVDNFKSAQRKWRIWGILFFVLNLIFWILEIKEFISGSFLDFS